MNALTCSPPEARAIKKLFVANRGEIAVRIIRAAREVGIETVLGCSTADRSSLAAQLADSVVEIGGSPAVKSYLNIAAITTAVTTSGADAVHPGYGFLSENAAFASAVEELNVIFVGPSPATIALMGNKVAARAQALLSGVACVPGSQGAVSDVAQAELIAEQIGYPVMLKAAAGGGGRGIRVAANAEELGQFFALASREALAAFGNGSLYIERYIANARHIEVQILGDGRNVVHLFDRECSLQRRRQKILEEAPSPSLDSATRDKLCESAVRLASSIGYRSAGTLEYLYDSKTGEFYFIEMNTRIQVEHPITEMITGVDIVRETLKIASGTSLRLRQEDIRMRGAALECRINAEDADKNFQPSVGTITGLTLPAGPGVRVDSMLYVGYTIPPFYDSLLAKVVVLDNCRASAIARMRRALRELQIEGVHSTAALHLRLLDHECMVQNTYDTRFIETWLADPALASQG